MNNLDTWIILNKELNHFNVCLIGHKKCQFYDSSGEIHTFSIHKAINHIKKGNKENIKLFASLWKDIEELLNKSPIDSNCYDSNLKRLFIFSLKDLYKLLSIFEEIKNSSLEKGIENALNKDINYYDKSQIEKLSDYKISIDWIFRTISRYQYIINLLKFASIGRKQILTYNIKLARGVSGPWSNLDLPMEERVYSYESEDMRGLRGRSRDKRYQRRYQKGLDNYAGPNVGEGHYWRELRNEPFSWYNRSSDSPYPGRNALIN